MIQWSTTDNRSFIGSGATARVLPPGYYTANATRVGLIFSLVDINTEEILDFPDSNSDAVVKEIEKFWDREEVFDEFNLNFKRGIMLYGPPGTGKTCTVQKVVENVVDRGGIALMFNDVHVITTAIETFRQIQPETEIVVVMEDFEDIMEHCCESEMLNFLGGMTRLHKVVFLATTNYLEELPPRIINRPSRFDKKFEVGFPNKESRKIYFEHIIKGTSAEGVYDLDYWAEQTEGYSIAHLKELFIAVHILGDELETALKTLRNMIDDVIEDDTEVTQNAIEQINRLKRVFAEIDAPDLEFDRADPEYYGE